LEPSKDALYTGDVLTDCGLLMEYVCPALKVFPGKFLLLDYRPHMRVIKDCMT